MADDKPAEGTQTRIIRPDFGPVEAVSLTKARTPQTRYQAGGGGSIYQELGRTGLRHWGGFVFEEWLRELQQGRRRAEVIREMVDSDPVIGGMLHAIETLCRRVTWFTKPASSSQLDQKNAKWADSLRDDMNHAWTDVIAEVLSFLPYGFSLHEEVFKQRLGDNPNDKTKHSKYDDGTIGIRKLAIRSQDSLWKWVFDETGGIEGMIQNPPPDYRLRFIPIEKALLFRTTVMKDNPEGDSILRSAYRSWYMTKNLQNIEGIGIERDLAGLPMLTAPEGVDIWDTLDPNMASIAQTARNVVSSIRRDEQEGVLLPFGWDLKLLSTGGRRQMDVSATIIRYEQRIATSVLLDVILMGQDKVGSYALAGIKKGLFTQSLEAYLDQIASVWNKHCLPQLFRMNGFDTDAGYPELCHGTVEAVDLDTLGNYVQKLAGAGAPLFGNDIEDPLYDFLLSQAGLPKPNPGVMAESAMPPSGVYTPLGGGGAKADGPVTQGGGKGSGGKEPMGDASVSRASARGSTGGDTDAGKDGSGEG